MATLVCLHAHPDAETIATGGAIMKAGSEEHDVLLIVVATRGGQGEPAEGDTSDGDFETEFIGLIPIATPAVGVRSAGAG